MAHHFKRKFIARDISWLSFNARVLQEAADPTVPLLERIKFLGIFSNNLDEFFKVRVASLRRMIQLGNKAKMHLENNPQQIIDEIQMTVLNQQGEFSRIWEDLKRLLTEEKIFIRTEKELNREQQKFVHNHFEEEVSANVIPLMIENIAQFPTLKDKSIYLAVVMWEKANTLKRKYALIEIPCPELSRFTILPSPKPEEHHIILLEDIIRANLPEIFSYFGYDQYAAHIFKVTRDAEIDIDEDISLNIIQKLEKGIKNRKKAKPVRFAYDREMDPGLLEYLIRRLKLTKKDNLIPGGRIHNYRHFMEFPEQVFKNKKQRKKPFEHPELTDKRVSDTILKKDVLLHFPYHSFLPLIDLIREAAFDPDVTTIKIACYRLAAQSKIINALINAVRNGKDVVVMLELRARFEEEANIEWKSRLEEEGAKVLIDIPDLKVHSKICMISKKSGDHKFINYGFIGTGNFNEKTAKVYGDHCLLTSNQKIMADVNRIFNFLEQPKSGINYLKDCKRVIPSPVYVKREMLKLIGEEIKQAHKKKPAAITLKMNSLSDEEMIVKLYEAARAGVKIKLIIRGIFCMLTENKKYEKPVRAISIVDEYLEHARVWIFHNRGKKKVFISSADWMTRNLEHRVEATCPIWNQELQKELIDILDIQLKDNVKARWLDNNLSNEYVQTKNNKVRSQVAIYNYLYKKAKAINEVSSN